jgi:hypothetical protein
MDALNSAIGFLLTKGQTMAKRVLPKWGVDGVHIAATNPFTDQSILALMDHLGTTRADIVHIAVVYLNSRSQQLIPRATGAPTTRTKAIYDEVHGDPITRAERNSALDALVRANAKFPKATRRGEEAAEGRHERDQGRRHEAGRGRRGRGGAVFRHRIRRIQSRRALNDQRYRVGATFQIGPRRRSGQPANNPAMKRHGR